MKKYAIGIVMFLCVTAWQAVAEPAEKGGGSVGSTLGHVIRQVIDQAVEPGSPQSVSPPSDETSTERGEQPEHD